MRPEVDLSIALLFREMFFVGMAQVEKLQRALEQVIDIFLAGLMRGEELVQIKVWETAIGHTRRQDFAQSPRIDGAEPANLFEYNALQRIVEDTGIKQFTDFLTRTALNQHRAEQPKRISL
jgi:hypothetical protein